MLQWEGEYMMFTHKSYACLVHAFFFFLEHTPPGKRPPHSALMTLRVCKHCILLFLYIGLGGNSSEQRQGNKATQTEKCEKWRGLQFALEQCDENQINPL